MQKIGHIQIAAPQPNALLCSMCVHGAGNYMFGSFGTSFVTPWLIFNVTCSPCVFNNLWESFYCHTDWAMCIIRVASDWDVLLCWFLHGLTQLFLKSVWTVMKQSYARACDASLQEQVTKAVKLDAMDTSRATRLLKWCLFCGRAAKLSFCFSFPELIVSLDLNCEVRESGHRCWEGCC